MAPPRQLKRLQSTDRDISPPAAKRKITTTTTTTSAAAVANFFTPTSQKPPERLVFHTYQDSLLTAHYDHAPTAALPQTRPPQPVKIAAFDFDSTLIKTKSGNKFARGPDDWIWWHASVPGKLRQLHRDGFVVVVLSNQGGISLKSDLSSKTLKSDMKSLSNFKARVSAVTAALGFPLSVYAATEKDLFRKPRSGMWEKMLRDYAPPPGDAVGVMGDDAGELFRAVDLEMSIFVGDAAGREADPAKGLAKDFSCSDRDLAANIGIPFATPEEFFLEEAPRPFVRSFLPAQYLAQSRFTDTSSLGIKFTKKNDLDIVLFCGSPGAGKSTFFWTHLAPLGYERVNQDILKTRDKCLRVGEDFLTAAAPRSIVVDNTNADVATRAVWITLAQRLKIPVRLVLFTAPAKLCEHNDTVRALSNGVMNPEKRTLLPKIAFTSFVSRYRSPELAEGFQDITPVDFTFVGGKAEELLWSRYWVS